MRLTYRYRLSPTRAQRTALNRTLDICLRVYNEVLHTRRQAWEKEGVSLTRYGTINLLPQWKAEQPWLADVHSQVLQEVCTRVDLAYQAFFRRVKAGEKEVGFPRFKGTGWYKSFTFPQAGIGWKLLDNGRLRLSRIGDVKIRLHRAIKGEMKTLIIKRDALGNWYACFSVEVEHEPRAPSPHVVGIDLGLSHFATLSTGEHVPNPRFFRRDEKALAKAQRQASIFAKGTPQRRKANRAVQHIHERIANRRKDFAHQLSRKLVATFQVLAFEDLKPSNMVKNHSLAKSISDAAWNQLVQYVSYKAASADRTLALVNPAYTSQDCSGCGERVPKALSVRVHRCPRCGLELDRDVNAALNVLARGLSSIGSNP